MMSIYHPVSFFLLPDDGAIDMQDVAVVDVHGMFRYRHAYPKE